MSEVRRAALRAAALARACPLPTQAPRGSRLTARPRSSPVARSRARSLRPSQMSSVRALLGGQLAQLQAPWV